MNVQHFKHHQHYLSHISIIISIHMLLLINIPIHHAKDDIGKYYSKCSKNTTFKCGKTTLNPISYPFWVENIRPSYCGFEGFTLGCERNETPVIDIRVYSKYGVVKIDLYTVTITLNLMIIIWIMIYVTPYTTAPL